MPFTAAQKRKIGRQYARHIWRLLTANLGSDNVEEAADAIEAFLTNNATSLNNALPVPFRTTATTAEKRVLFALVAVEMAGLGPIDGGD